jgi:transposase
VPTLAGLFDLDPKTIRSYIQRYNEGGLAKLKPDYGQGRPISLAWSKEEWLTLFGQAPSQFDKLNTGAQNWTQELMVHYLAEYHQVQVTQPAISTMLKRVGLKWKRAKLRIKSPDPLYVVKRQRVADLKQKAQNGTLTAREATHPPPDTAKPAKLFYLDSTDLHWCPDPGQTYGQVGQQNKVDTPGYDNPWLALFGSLAFPCGEGLYSIHEHKRHLELLYHLQVLIDTYPDHFLFVVLDNASAHTTPKVLEFWADHQSHLELVFLPTYSPHLNLIERLWWVLRRQVTRTQFFDSLDALAAAVVNWFELYPFAKFCSLLGVDESQLNFLE